MHFALLITFIIATTSSSTEVKNEAKNLNASFHGYNPLYGNLLQAGSADPGTRSKIFEAALDDESIDINFDKNCAADNRESIYQSMYEYNLKKIGSFAHSAELSKSFSSENLNISIGELKVNVQAALEGQSSLDNETLIFRHHAGEIYLNEVRCQLYTVSINEFVDQSFTSNFKNGTKQLDKAIKSKNQTEINIISRLFIEEFGTHFMQTTYMGASLAIESRWLSKAKRHSEIQTRKQCLSTAFSESVSSDVGILGLFDGSSALTFKNQSKTCKRNSMDTDYFSSNQLRETNIVARGANFNSDPVKWAQTAKDDPVPIDFKLRRISYIFRQKGWLDSNDLNIDGEELANHLDNFTSNYCENVLGIDCPPVRGCGVSMVCESDPGKGFTFSVTELVEGDFLIKDNGNVSISGQIHLKSGNYTLIGSSIKAKLKIRGSLCQFLVDTQGFYNLSFDDDSKNCVIKRKNISEKHVGFIIENHEEKEAKCQYQDTSSNVSVQGTFNLPPGQQYSVIGQDDGAMKIQCSFPGVSSSCDLLSSNPGPYRLALDKDKCDLYMLVQ